MAPVLIFALIMAAIAVVALLMWRARQRRREEIALFAFQHGLEYSRTDPFDLIEYPFRLFTLGDGRGCENVVWGDWEGLPVKEADFWYYTEHRDSKGHTSRSYRRFSAVVADLPAMLPPVALERERLLSRLADHVGFRDIEFESEDFNRLFQVQAGDPEFAYKLVDARMIRWLLSTDGEFGFEVCGPNLLVWCRGREPSALASVLACAKLFHDHIPRLVWTEYGTSPTPGPGEERSVT